jgi:hypothetical protein
MNGRLTGISIRAAGGRYQPRRNAQTEQSGDGITINHYGIALYVLKMAVCPELIVPGKC